MLAGTLEKRIGEKSGRQSLPEAWKWQKRYFVLSEPQGEHLHRIRLILRHSPSEPAACAAATAPAPFPSKGACLYVCGMTVKLASYHWGHGRSHCLVTAPLAAQSAKLQACANGQLAGCHCSTRVRDVIRGTAVSCHGAC